MKSQRTRKLCAHGACRLAPNIWRSKNSMRTAELSPNVTTVVNMMLRRICRWHCALRGCRCRCIDERLRLCSDAASAIELTLRPCVALYSQHHSGCNTEAQGAL